MNWLPRTKKAVEEQRYEHGHPCVAASDMQKVEKDLSEVENERDEWAQCAEELFNSCFTEPMGAPLDRYLALRAKYKVDAPKENQQ